MLKIGRDDAWKIWNTVRNNPVGEGGRLREFRTEEWRDPELRDLFRGSLVSATDSIINTPKPGQKPLLFSKEMGRLFLQYKGFSFAAAAQTLIPGLQQPSFAWMTGAVMGTGLGAVSIYLKAVAGGWDLPDPNTESGLAWWIANSVDRAGFTGILSDANNWMGFATRGQFSAGRLLGAGPNRRDFVHTNRNLITEMIGPSASTGVDVAKVVEGLADALYYKEQPPTRAYNALRRLTPLNNYVLTSRLVMQPFFRHLERGVRRELADELARGKRGVPRERTFLQEIR